MLNLLFKTTAYYVIWQKFKKQIIVITFSIILISLIGIIYEDLFKVLKVSSKENIGILLFTKWFLISIIIAFNIYVLRQTSIESKEKLDKNEKVEEILTKEVILERADLILKKYTND